MASVLHMPRVNFGGWNFRLLWNGKAMIEWNHREDADEDVSIYTPERAAEMLHLMAQEAAAACSVYGYAADDVPLLDELKTYLLYAAAPWEMYHVIECINEALAYGYQRDYRPEDNGMVDVDTIELKKN